MCEPNPGDAKPPVFKPMDVSTAETLLKEAREILDGLGIVFFLRHGTCLAAVRDHALIEWDDDLDIGSIIGLHGLTEDAIEAAAEAFREHGYDAIVTESDLHVSLELTKHGTPIAWVCYRIIDDSIYQYPVVKIPVSLHTDLKPIEFLREQFNVPNPPEEYLRLKYGPEWMIPKRTGFEQDILDLIPEEEPSGGPGNIMRLLKRLLPRRNAGSLKVLDFEDRPVEGAEVVLAATTVLSGLVRSTTGRDGRTRLDLPDKGYYVLAVRYGDHKEVLFMEKLEPGIDYVYRPDPEVSTDRTSVLATSRQASQIRA